MFGETNAYDMERLRRDLENDCLAAYFGGGFGAALIDCIDTGRASDDELVEMARRKGFDLGKYRV